MRRKSPAGGSSIGPNGVAVGWGKVYANKGTDRMNAFDLATGVEAWDRPISRTQTDGIDIQPQVWDRKVYVSSVPVSLDGIYVGGDRGTLYALSEADGSTQWSFDTVDSPDLWGNPEVNSGGGAWFPPSIDVASGRMFWGIANPAPFPGTAEIGRAHV